MTRELDDFWWYRDLVRGIERPLIIEQQENRPPITEDSQGLAVTRVLFRLCEKAGHEPRLFLSTK